MFLAVYVLNRLGRNARDVSGRSAIFSFPRAHALLLLDCAVEKLQIDGNLRSPSSGKS